MADSSQPVTHDIIIVHHLENARSQRILWLLEELELPYEVKKYKRTPQRLAPKELLDVHPLGKSPVITDGAITLAESGAIVEYLIGKYGKDNSKVKIGEAGWVDNLYFTHYPEGSLQPLLVRRLLFKVIPDRTPFIIRPLVKGIFSKIDAGLISPELKKHGELIEAHLKTSKNWFAGGERPTSADYMMSFTLEVFLNRAPEHAGELMKEYVKRVQARPAYKRALEKGGEYAYVLK